MPPAMGFETHGWPLFALALAAISWSAPVLAADPPPNESAPHPELRRALRDTFRYAPARDPQIRIDLPDAHPPAGPVIELPKMIVYASKINLRELDRGIAREQARAQSQKMKWGCGPLYQKDFGKVRFGVISIFYIPVAIGFSW